MPVFMRAGCNTGSCHGAARGKDGFRLSLFGFDPDGDYNRLTREHATAAASTSPSPRTACCSRRRPARCRTPAASGSRRTATTTQTLIRWLEAGAPNDPADRRQRRSRWSSTRKNAVLDGKGDTQQMTVRAKYSDGTDRDVTSLALFLTQQRQLGRRSTDDGLVTAGERGEAFVMARFATFTVGSQVIVLPKGLQVRLAERAREQLHRHAGRRQAQEAADRPVGALHRRGLPPPRLPRRHRPAADARGVRPVHGSTRPEQAREAGRRAARPQGVRRDLGDEVGRAAPDPLGRQPASATRRCSSTTTGCRRRSPATCRSTRSVQELLGATGGTFKNPATNYYQIETDTLKLAENIAQVFMGMRIQCAQCHNHPFDRWTQDDYYGFAAFFAQIGRKQGEDPRETIVFNSGGGEVNHPRRRAGDEAEVPRRRRARRRRARTAAWCWPSGSPRRENPYFAKNLANIVWAHFFGRGIIEPVDDVRISNPPSNPELLEELGKQFTEYKYDFKQLVRDICTRGPTSSRPQPTTTQRARRRGTSPTPPIRRIRAETLLDCISQVTETKDKFRGLPLGAGPCRSPTAARATTS